MRMGNTVLATRQIFINMDDNKPKRKRKKGADGAPKEHKKPWKEEYATVDDIQNFLMDRVLLRHNVITKRAECRAPSVPPRSALPLCSAKNWRDDTALDGCSPCGGRPEEDWAPISDRIVNSLWTEMSRMKPVRIQDMYRVIESDFVPEYHPFLFYLSHLPPWNGEDDYILELSLSVNVKGDATAQLQFAEYLRKWLVGMVAGWVDDSVVNNVILVLIGEQGSYKTTWFNYLLPPELKQYFYTKTNAQRMGRDDLLTLAQYGLVCCEELDTMRPSELNQLKAAVTMPSIDERAAYAHFHEHRKHIASFCGTGNNVQFLSDPTGNRRWLPFEVQSILSPRDHPFNYEGIYSQAYALYREGFQFWFSREEVLQLSAHNRQFETPRLEEELVDVYFRPPVGIEGGEFMPVSRAMQIVSGNMVHQISAVSLGRAFTNLGFQYKRTSTSRGYIVIQRTAEEIRQRLRQLAGDG